MKFLKNSWLRIWHSIPLEQLKGALWGGYLRLANKQRYSELIRIRPNRAKLVRIKYATIDRISTACKAKGINLVKIYGRVKTIGSLDRKERYASKKFPGAAEQFVREELVGLTIVVESRGDCYAVLEALKTVGKFPILGYRENPRDYIKGFKGRSAESHITDAITATVAIPGFTELIQVRIFTRETTKNLPLVRGQYKKRISNVIKEK